MLFLDVFSWIKSDLKLVVFFVFFKSEGVVK